MKTLEQRFNEIGASVEDATGNIDWTTASNGTGYYDGMQNHHLPEGKVVSFVCPRTKRRGLIVGHGDTEDSTILFERYTPGHGPFVIVQNANQQLVSWLRGRCNGALSLETFEDIIAFRMEDIRKMDFINKVVDELIALAQTTNDSFAIQCNDLFWVQEYAPERAVEFKAAYDAFMGRVFKKKAV